MTVRHAIVAAGLALLVIETGGGSPGPLPKALLTAQSVHVLNEAGERFPVEAVAEELKAWNRYKVTGTPEEADLILTVGVTNAAAALGVPTSSMETSAPKVVFTMDIRDRASNESLWKDTQSVGLGYKRALKKMVKRLRDRVNKEKM